MDNSNTDILEDLGFTRAEIKVYLALLENGSSSAGPIIEGSRLQSSVVHMTLNKLIKNGFVSYIKNGQRNIYQASDPRHILEYIDEKKQAFQDILPALLEKRKSVCHEEVTSFRGKNGIKELLYSLLETGGKDHHTFGSAKESLMMGHTFWRGYHQKRAAKGIKAKLLFNESLRGWCLKNKYPRAEYRFTAQGFEPLTETIIRNDCIGIILWTDNPIGILIKSKIAAESYNQFWSMMWKALNPKS